MVSGFTFENHYWRAFNLADFGITGEFDVCDVEIGIESATSVGGTQPLTVNLYSALASKFPNGTLTAIGTANLSVVDQTQTLLTIPVTGAVPPGQALVVEIVSPDGTTNQDSFLIGSNADSQTAPSYLSAASCNINTPTDLTALGHPDMHIVMSAHGTEVAAIEALPAGMIVDPVFGGGILHNTVLEMGETPVVLAPSWQNPGLTDFTMTGTIANFTGPLAGAGVTYSIPDNTATYGTIPAGGTVVCSECYGVQINGTRQDTPVHTDASVDETVTPVGPALGQAQVILKTWTLHVGESFSDVINDITVDPFYPAIETLLHTGVTAGCGDGTTFCPDSDVLRQEMAVFLLKAFLGKTYVPPACTPPGQFTDVPCPGLYTDFIEDLKTRGITAGCGDGTTFCPVANVLRQEMAVFLLKTLLGGAYVPPACTPPGIFTDVPCPGQYTDFIEDLKTRGITAGCGDGTMFCPTNSVTRQEMAAFLTLTFSLVLYGP
jgi:hypothetical protein